MSPCSSNPCPCRQGRRTGSSPPATAALGAGEGPHPGSGCRTHRHARCDRAGRDGIHTIVYSRESADSQRADRVREIGATYLSAEQTPIDKISSVTGAIDVIYEAVGVASVAFAATETLAPNGLLILTGIPAPAEPATLPLDRIMKDMVLNNQAIVGTVNVGRSAFALAVEKLEQAMALVPDSVRTIITERVPLEAAPQALKQPHGVKDIIEVHG
jgi:glucose 1-dehydrogenase